MSLVGQKRSADRLAGLPRTRPVYLGKGTRIVAGARTIAKLCSNLTANADAGASSFGLPLKTTGLFARACGADPQLRQPILLGPAGRLLWSAWQRKQQRNQRTG
jgi:hypothetical protein